MIRAMWKDWGFAAALFGQAKYFLSLAKETDRAPHREACIRAAIIFALMAFEATFFREIISAYIEQKSATIHPDKAKKVKDGLTSKTGIAEAVRKWPKWLTGTPLARSPSPVHFENLLEYRNALVHGKIIEKIRWGRKHIPAQEVETVSLADLAVHAIGEMITVATVHFGFNPPSWI